MENKIKVLIAEDLEPIRVKYAYYLGQCPEIELTGSVSSVPSRFSTTEMRFLPDIKHSLTSY